MSLCSSLLTGGVDAVSLISALSSLLTIMELPACCSNSMIVSLVYGVLSLSAAQGCAFQMRCGIAVSSSCSVVVESEALSTFAAQEAESLG